MNKSSILTLSSMFLHLAQNLFYLVITGCFHMTSSSLPFNPFEHKHHEEQYITNPKDVILFNYGASMPDYNNKPTLASSSSSSDNLKGIHYTPF